MSYIHLPPTQVSISTTDPFFQVPHHCFKINVLQTSNIVIHQPLISHSKTVISISHPSEETIWIFIQMIIKACGFYLAVSFLCYCTGKVRTKSICLQKSSRLKVTAKIWRSLEDKTFVVQILSGGKFNIKYLGLICLLFNFI